jgi:hypothetical protein
VIYGFFPPKRLPTFARDGWFRRKLPSHLCNYFRTYCSFVWELPDAPGGHPARNRITVGERNNHQLDQVNCGIWIGLISLVQLVRCLVVQTQLKHQNNEDAAHPKYQAPREEAAHNVNGCIYRSSRVPRLGRAANPPAVSLKVPVEPFVKPDDSAVCLVPVQTAVCSSRATGLVAHIPQC